MQAKLDVDALLSLILTWLLMTGYVALAYLGVAAAGTLPFSDPRLDFSPPWWLTLLAFILIALTFGPVYRWIRPGVRDLVYSQYENPYPAFLQLNRRLESTSSPRSILPTIAETIAQTLKLPFIEIEAHPPEVDSPDAPLVIAFGRAPEGAVVESIPLSYHGTLIGELHVAARRGDERLSQSDLTVLKDLARQVGIALYAAQLTDELQQARERLVIAREEERRRIRNDLHDGLAPTLSSLNLQLGAVRRLIHQNPDQAEALLEELSQDLRGATAEIRQLVYDLRPPMLDELGLVAAIKNFKFPDSNVSLTVQASEPMPRLSAAVEVAVYQIAREAVHNVIKHAQATCCVVTIEISSCCLTLSVTDNGTSLPYQPTTGVGFQSMKERVTELGGSISIQSCETGGTCVTAEFPVDLGD